jgi:non-ribosomal peptide synthetase component F
MTAASAEPTSARRGPPSIDDPVDWGKYRGQATYRELAQRQPHYAAWAARKIGGLKGQLCAEALAAHLGVL